MASNISKWQTRQGELKAEIAQNQASASVPVGSIGVNSIPVATKQAVAKSSVHSFFSRDIDAQLQDKLLTQFSISNRLAGCFARIQGRHTGRL